MRSTADLQNSNFLGIASLARIHKHLVNEYGGSQGVLSQESLESCLNMPQMGMFDSLAHPTVIEQAAAYFYYLSKAHAFLDGNKRTAFASMITFLAVNGYSSELSVDEAITLVLDVVTSIKTKEDLIYILREHTRPI